MNLPSGFTPGFALFYKILATLHLAIIDNWMRLVESTADCFLHTNHAEPRLFRSNEILGFVFVRIIFTITRATRIVAN